MGVHRVPGDWVSEMVTRGEMKDATESAGERHPLEAVKEVGWLPGMPVTGNTSRIEEWRC